MDGEGRLESHLQHTGESVTMLYLSVDGFVKD
jgi:hypothetical protein